MPRHLRRALKLAFCVTGLGILGAQVFTGSYAEDDPAGSDTAARESAGSADMQRPEQLIESMTQALHTLNYEGVFVHAQGASLTSMHILHASNENGEFERLISLDGEAREVIRDNSLVTCIWPESESVEISHAQPRDLLPRIDSSLAGNPRYEFSLGSPDRVAGRMTHVVNVVPRDQYRYGYRLWIDADTSMLLRSMLLQKGRYPIEQVIFTSIEYPDHIDISRFDIIIKNDKQELVSWLEPEKARARSGLERRTSKRSDRVGFTSLPDGYQKVSETFTALSMKEGPMSHVMISDGMASVSVYVEYIGEGRGSDALIGLSRMGAMNAYGIKTGSARITAVGEVPEATVRAIAAAVILKE